MRCGLPSAAGLAEISAIDIKATVTRYRRKPGMMESLRPNQCISVFGQRENLPAADLNRGPRGNEFRPLAGFALDRIHGIEADIETYALRDQALDPFAVGVVRVQQIDARTERHDLDGDLVRSVEFQEIIGDAEHEALFPRIIVRKLQHDAMLGEWLVRQRLRLGAGGGRGEGHHQCRDHGMADGANNRPPGSSKSMHPRTHHPCPVMPGLSSTPLSTMPAPRPSGVLGERRCLARTSHIGMPFCSLTEAHPATL